MKRDVHVSRHLRRVPQRHPSTVTTPHPRQFAKPRTPPRPRKIWRTRGGHTAHPRVQARPKPAKAGGLVALTLDDFDVIGDQPRPIRRGAFRPPVPEPVVETGMPTRTVQSGGELDGIARGKEVLMLVKHDAGREISGKAIFKPGYGEPSWSGDFGIPNGQQYIREAVTATLDRLLYGKGERQVVVPATAIRVVGGNVGSLQEWKDGTRALYKVEREHGKYSKDDLAKIVALDIITGNIDRHGGNALVEKNGKVWGIDHGGTFPTRRLFGINDPYISTLKGSPIPPDVRKALNDLDEGDLRAALAPLLIEPETGHLAVEEAVTRWSKLKNSVTFPSALTAENWTEEAEKRHRAEAERRGRAKSGVRPPSELVAELEDEDVEIEDDEDKQWCEECQVYHSVG